MFKEDTCRFIYSTVKSKSAVGCTPPWSVLVYDIHNENDRWALWCLVAVNHVSKNNAIFCSICLLSQKTWTLARSPVLLFLSSWKLHEWKTEDMPATPAGTERLPQSAKLCCPLMQLITQLHLKTRWYKGYSVLYHFRQQGIATLSVAIISLTGCVDYSAHSSIPPPPSRPQGSTVAQWWASQKHLDLVLVQSLYVFPVFAWGFFPWWSGFLPHHNKCASSQNVSYTKKQTMCMCLPTWVTIQWVKIWCHYADETTLHVSAGRTISTTLYTILYSSLQCEQYFKIQGLYEQGIVQSINLQVSSNFAEVWCHKLNLHTEWAQM